MCLGGTPVIKGVVKANDGNLRLVGPEESLKSIDAAVLATHWRHRVHEKSNPAHL